MTEYLVPLILIAGPNSDNIHFVDAGSRFYRTPSKPYKPYDDKLLKFYWAKHRHVGNSNVSRLLWISRTAYFDEHVWTIQSIRRQTTVLNTGRGLHVGMNIATETGIPYCFCPYENVSCAHEPCRLQSPLYLRDWSCDAVIRWTFALVFRRCLTAMN